MSLIPVFEIGIWNAWIFTVIILLPVVLIPMVNKKAYKRLSNPSDMKLSKKEKVISYIATSTITIIVFLYSIFLPLKLGTAWFYVGLLIFLLAMAVQILAAINFITTPLERVVTKGIYGYSRNPLYLSDFLVFIGIGIATASWVILFISIIFIILIKVVVISEEGYLREKYGNSFSKYLSRTPRWLGIPKS